MKFQLKAFWLFLLTFVLSMQQQGNHKQLSTDCCCCHTAGYAVSAAAGVTATTITKPMATMLQANLKRSTTEIEQSTTKGNELANEYKKWRQTASERHELLIGDITTMQTATPTPTAVEVEAVTTTKSMQKSISHAKNAQTIKRFKARKLTENFTMDFRESVAKLFANDDAAAATLTSAAAVKSITPATTTTTTTTTATTKSTIKNASTLHQQRQTERRHIVPEKLQYTKEIQIKQGRLMGIIRHFQPVTGLRDVDQYLGLPYAEAPVGSRRFMPPGTPLPWQGLKIARHLPPVCPQKLPDVSLQASEKMSRGRYKHLTRLLPYLKTESEDCLYLNLYVPHEDLLEPRQQYPVLVYLHGESFEWNSGNAYDGSVLSSYGQVIVVTVNYRLGILGFLRPSIDDQDVANFALLDQIAALHWIKENIVAFGGDNTRVTLMGHSQGAACVNYLMVSPVASGLFHRAILMSGSAMSDWAASNHTLQLTMQAAHALECPLNGIMSDGGAGDGIGDTHEPLIECLRRRRYQDILSVPTTFPQFSTSLGPIVDGHVIPNQPYKVMGHYTEHFSRYDLLFGVTESESYHTLGALALEEGLRENERDNLLRFYMQSRFDVRPDLALAATLKKYQDMYTNPIKATNLEHRDVVLEIFSDARIVGPLMQTGLFHADVNRRNFMYVFGHNSASGPHATLPHSITGEELAFIFGAPLAPAGPFPSNNFSTQEKLLSEAVMAYWTNFVKTGHPKAPWLGTFLNSHALEWERYDIEWPEFTKRTQAYLNIGIPPSVGYKYRQVYMNFWNKELPDELNQIAAIQERQQHAFQTTNGGLTATNFLYPSSAATTTQLQLQPQTTRLSGSDVITGHMSKYGVRDNGVEDPVRTLKLLLQEPHKVGNGAGDGDGDGDGAGPLQVAPETAENMYNAPPTFGHVHKQQQHHQQPVPMVEHDSNGGGIDGEFYAFPTQVLHRQTSPTMHSSSTKENDINAMPASVATATSEPPIAKSETTLQLLIGLIVVFIVLNIIIYSTFLLQKRRKATNMKRKLGVGGILSYDGATDDELKRCSTSKKHGGDGDDSYALDSIVRKSNTYEAIRMERSPINGYKVTRQLSSSTVDTHTKVSEWMAAVGGGVGGMATLPRGEVNQQTKSGTPTFSSLSSNAGGDGNAVIGSFSTPAAHKVNVAIDATPQARSDSILRQEPIELTKLKADGGRIIICQDMIVNDHELLTPQNSLDASRYEQPLQRQHSNATTEPSDAPLHQHTRSEPIDVLQYYENVEQQEQITSFCQADNTRDINVTSRRDDEALVALTPAEQLALLKQRNYPKVLPTTRPRDSDSPPMTADLSLTYKRNSLPPNSFLPNFVVGCGRQAPAPPPRTISTLGRNNKPTAARRDSNNVTTSPLMLAQDCIGDDEQAELPIAQNTLIVGPIVPKTPTKLSGGGTLGRKIKPNDIANCGDSEMTTTAASLSAAIDGTGNDSVKSVATCGSAFQSFESVPPSAISNELPSGVAQHTTERIYAIGEANTATTSLPSWPAPNGDIYAQPVKSPSKTSLIPRMLPLSSATVDGSTKGNQAVTTNTNTNTTAKPVKCNQTVTATSCSPTTATAQATANTTTATEPPALAALATIDTTTPLTSPSSSNPMQTQTRIPQLHRNAQTQNQSQSQTQQHPQQNQINKDKPKSVMTAAETTTSSPPSTTTTPVSSSTTTNASNNKRSASSYSTASSTSSSSCLSTSSCSSTSSGSSSSTGTVRTELQQRKH